MHEAKVRHSSLTSGGAGRYHEYNITKSQSERTNNW